jgi:hypothetical protein
MQKTYLFISFIFLYILKILKKFLKKGKMLAMTWMTYIFVSVLGKCIYAITDADGITTESTIGDATSVFSGYTAKGATSSSSGFVARDTTSSPSGSVARGATSSPSGSVARGATSSPSGSVARGNTSSPYGSSARGATSSREIVVIFATDNNILELYTGNKFSTIL